MPLMSGIYEPAASTSSQEAIVADVNPFFAAVTGRRLLGYKATLAASGGAARAKLIKGLVGGNSVTSLLGAIELSTGDQDSDSAWFGPAGIDISGGMMVDWVSGNPGIDLTVFYIDVT